MIDRGAKVAGEKPAQGTAMSFLHGRYEQAIAIRVHGLPWGTGSPMH